MLGDAAMRGKRQERYEGSSESRSSKDEDSGRPSMGRYLTKTVAGTST